MKFEQYYEKTKILEWKQLYIHYPLLKRMIKPFEDTLKLQNLQEDKSLNFVSFMTQNKRQNQKLIIPQELETRLIKIEQDFVDFLKTEMEKCNQFFQLNLKKIDIKVQKLKYNLIVMQEKQSRKDQTQRDIAETRQNYHILKQSTKNLYRECFLLSNFSHLNGVASRKLIKNYKEKVFFLENTTKNLLKFTEQKLKLEMFNDSNKLGQIQEDIEYLYITYFSRDDPKKGVQTLKLESHERYLTSKYSFVLGLYFGIANFILLNILINRIEMFISFDNSDTKYYPLFCGLGLFLSYYWFMAISVYIWNRCHVNYRQCFKFNYHHSTIFQILRRVCFFTMMFLLIFLGSIEKEFFIIADANAQNYYNPMLFMIAFPPDIGPLIIWSVILFYLLIPTTKSFNARGRKYLWKQLGIAILSPFGPISFTSTFIMEQLTSLIGPMKDLVFTVYFYVQYFQNDLNDKFIFKNMQEYGLIVTLIPLSIRLCQNLRIAKIQSKRNLFYSRFMYNFLIYLMAIFTTISAYLSTFIDYFFYIWLLLGFITAISSFAWDILIEFNFLNRDSKFKYLRKQLASNNPNHYYVALVLSFILKFNWILTISPNLTDLVTVRTDFFIFIICFAEIFRRFIWNLISIESEHLANIGAFKSVPEIIYPYETKLKKESCAYQDDKLNKSIVSEDRQSKGSTISQYYSPNNDIYKDKIEQIKDLEKKLFLSHTYEDSNEEEIHLNNMGAFQTKVDRISSGYPEKLNQISREVKEIQQYVNSFGTVDPKHKLNQLNQPLLVKPEL